MFREFKIGLNKRSSYNAGLKQGVMQGSGHKKGFEFLVRS